MSAAIARAALEVDASIIAIDSHHLTMMGHLLQGSTSMEVLGHTDTPLLVAGPHVNGRPVRAGYHVVVCSDGSPTSEDILVKLSSVLAAPPVKFTLLRIYEPRLGDEGRLIELESCEQYLHGLRAQFPDASGVDCKVSVVEGLESVPHAIIRIAADLDADAIAMATQGSSAARHVLVGSVALAVAGHADVPVLLARGER
jgi:nucleotide-binding universal stress UspA family protein